MFSKGACSSKKYQKNGFSCGERGRRTSRRWKGRVLQNMSQNFWQGACRQDQILQVSGNKKHLTFYESSFIISFKFVFFVSFSNSPSVLSLRIFYRHQGFHLLVGTSLFQSWNLKLKFEAFDRTKGLYTVTWFYAPDDINYRTWSNGGTFAH